MKPSIRLMLAACVLAAAVLVGGCGHKRTAVAPAPKQTQTAAKPDQAKAAPASPSGTPSIDLGQPANPFAGALKGPLAASTPAVGKAVAPARPLPSKPTPAQLLAALENAYSLIPTLRAEGSSTTLTRADGQMVGKSQDARMTLLFSRPNKISIDSGQGRFITDGKLIFNYVPSMKRYTKGKMTNDVMRQLASSRPGVGVLGLLLHVPYAQVIDTMKLLDETTIGGREVYVLSLRLKKGVGCPTGVDATETLWIGKKDLGLYRSEALLRYKPKPAKGYTGKLPKLVETSMTTTLSRFEPNAKVSASAFTFRPSAGVKLYEPPKPVDMSDKAAPDLSFKWTDGTAKKLSDFRGKIVLLDFWGLPLCTPQLPILQGLSKDHDVTLIAVNANTNRDKVEEYLKKNNFTFPVVFADANLVKTAASGYRVVMLPTLFIIDEKGVIREEFVGIVKQKDIEAKLDKIRPK